MPAPAGWPAKPDPAAYHGLIGEIVRVLEPETEADPVAILAQLRVAFGTAVGRDAYFEIEATRHHPHEFGVRGLLVQKTGLSRGHRPHAVAHTHAVALLLLGETQGGSAV